MTFTLNLALILVIVATVALFITLKIVKGVKRIEFDEKTAREIYSLNSLEKFVRDKITELTTLNLYNLGLSEEEFLRQSRRRTELKEALKNCNTGDIRSKIYVREFIYDLLQKEYSITDETINYAIPFNMPSQLTARDMFDTLLYLYEKKYGNEALGKLLEKFHLTDPKSDGGYRVEEDDIRKIYSKKVHFLSLEDKLRIVAQRVYSHFKGFGVIDEIRDMAIDGVSGGVSGLPNRMENPDDDEILISQLQERPTDLNSVWVMYKGKSIHFQFLSFEHEAELRRVVQNVYKYNFPGQLSESNPYMINEMYDGSRVTVVRPKLSETWAFFIRKKYDLKNLELEQLIIHKNKELPIKLMKFFMKGNRITAITGSQGSGKTTLLMALVKFIRKSLNLRVQETKFELNLRTLYPGRNILSFQETDTISGQEGLDLSKKTDGDVNILGEVATDQVAAWMIQTSQVASLFTIFTHHAKTFRDLVYSLRNSLLKVGMFSNESIAEQQVISVLEFDIHLRQDYDGSRYIERITECIPIKPTYPTISDTLPETKEEKLDLLCTVATNFFQQKAQQRLFEERNLIEFRDGQYVPVHRISKERQEEISKHLSPDERKEFEEFIRQVWGE